MTTINYTSAAADPTLDAAFERALATAREGRSAPLAHLISGEGRAVGEVFERADPCDPSRIVSRAHAGDAELVAAAVRAARAAQPEWAATPLAERTAALRRIGALISERLVELAGVVSAETGKIRLEAVPEVQEGVDLIETYCAFMETNDGYRIPLGRLSEREDNVSVMRPYGVFAVICPFNFPFALAVGMASGALVCGNTVVMKPAEETPWSTALIAELAVEAGLPTGVLNLVHGADATGRALVAAEIDGVAFTGSAEAGHAIMRELHARPPLRPMIAEMGGKNPAIVTASADLDRAAAGIVRSAYGLSGQKCSSCSRVVVDRSVHDELVERIVAGARELAVGDPADAGTNLGPVAGPPAVERFEAAVEDARRDGEIATGGSHDGGFAQPTRRHRPPAGPPAHARGAVPALPHRHRRRRLRGGDGGGQRGRVRADRRHLHRGPRREAGVPGPDRGGRDLRQPPRGRDHRRVAGDPDVLRMEGERRVRQGRPRAALPHAVHARADLGR